MEELKLPEPAAWRVAASYWTHRDSIPAALLPPTEEPVALFTADQVRECVRVAVEAERERLLSVMEAKMPSESRSVNWTDADHTAYQVLTELEDAIRNP